MVYNGWSNYETWICKLWLDNDSSLYNEIQNWLSDKTVTDLPSKLKSLILEMCPVLSASLYSDLLNTAISEIDFYEIAEYYLENEMEDQICELPTTKKKS